MMHRSLRLLAWTSLLTVFALARPAAQGSGNPPEFNPTSTLNWMVGGTTHAVERAGNTVFIGGEFRALAPRKNLTGGFAILGDPAAQLALRTPFVNGTVDAVLFDRDSFALYVAGRFTRVGTSTVGHIVRILSTGEVDTTFTARVVGRVHALALGTIAGSGATTTRVLYVGGEFTQAGVGVSLANVQNVAAFSVGTSFGSAPALLSGFASSPDQPVYSLATYTPAGTGPLVTTRLYVGGVFAAVGGATRSYLAAVDPVTGAAQDWNPGADDVVRAILPTTDGFTVFTGGDFQTIGGQPRHYVAALDAADPGGAALTWNPSADGRVRALALSGTSIYVGGDFRLIGGLARERLALLNTTDGSAFSSFDVPANGPVYAIFVRTPATLGPVYVGGAFTALGGKPRLHLAAIAPGSGTVTDWNPAMNDQVRSIDMIAMPFPPFPSGTTRLAVGGDFDAYGAVARRNLAAINLETGAVLPWRPSPDGPVHALQVAGGSLYVGGDFEEIGGEPRQRLAAFSRPGLQLTTWAPPADDAVHALASTVAAASGAVTIYAGGDFTNIGGQPRARIAAIEGTTGTPTAWAPSGGNGRVLSIHPTSTFIYAAGQFTMLGGLTVNYLARLDPATGAADAGWNPNPDGEVRAVVVGAGHVYAGGAFTTIGGQARANLGAVDTTSGTANEWQPNPNGAVNALHLQGTTLYAGGAFTTVGQSTSVRRRPRLVGLDTTLTGPTALYVTAFAPRWIGRVRALDYHTTGILAAGDNERDGEENEPVSRVAFFPRLINAPPAAPAGLSANAEPAFLGSTVTVQWLDPVLGSRPSWYLLEAGTTPGGTQISGGITVAGGSARFFGVPPGTYYLRLRSVNLALGAVSGPSEEVVLTVGSGCAAVNPPAYLVAAVAGSRLTLSWTPASGGTVSNYRIEAGLSRGVTQYQIPVAATDTSYEISVPPGVYYARVRALSPCGNSVTSNEVQIIVGGAGAPPAAPIDVDAQVTGHDVTITWSAPQGAVTGYQLEAGFAPGTSNAAVVALGTVTRFATSRVPSGVYFVRVRARGPAGLGPASDEVVVIVP